MSTGQWIALAGGGLLAGIAAGLTVSAPDALQVWTVGGVAGGLSPLLALGGRIAAGRGGWRWPYGLILGVGGAAVGAALAAALTASGSLRRAAGFGLALGLVTGPAVALFSIAFHSE